MDNKYKEYDNYIKIDKLTNLEWKLSDSQLNLLMDLSKEIYSDEQQLINALGKKVDLSVFLKQILYFEQNRNSNIEGSQTQFDDLFEIDRNYSDYMSWETRNLIDVALELFREIRQGTFLLSVDSIVRLHKKLYMNDKNKMTVDASEYIRKIRPGYILSNNDPVNWVGKKTSNREKDLQNATLIPVIPKDKREKLGELVSLTRDKIDKKELSILDISRFHVIFEGIHPFADGNGRLGRLIILALIQIIGITQFTILPFSEYIYKNKDKYIFELNKAQVTGNINSWNSYFIEMLIKSKHLHQNIIKKSISIINKYSYLKKNENKYKVFLKFFKHIKLKKDLTISKLVIAGMAQATAYRLFDEISNEINANKEGNFYVFEEMWEIYKGNYE